ncbi:MerR family transcriptional regulator [Luteipulveratus halotolerans]|uniref:HTH merR-type domain-containing protein n=1 Tax=Luteipulveratus halotolerans TaxID=1631356 RepID=A0A0L6CJ20_9MICO|nr:MerR family transcriptional regulator [Luteipulveratus halotolerans]KNX37488.1 hypothetical protein VV01_10555 [Luteipulveratus halotolerans]
MQIGEAARATRTSARSLRHYEAVGLIEPGRLANGFRDYCTSTLERVETIRFLLDAGLPVRLVAAALTRDATDGPAYHDDFLAEVIRFRDRIERRIERLVDQRGARRVRTSRVRSGLTLPPV